MTYEKFVEEYLSKGLLKEQKSEGPESRESKFEH